MERFELDYNPISRKFEEREKILPRNIVEELNLLDDIPAKKIQLQCIKKSKLKPSTGDIFVVEPVKGTCFYGRVLVGSVDYIDKDSYLNGTSIITIFKNITDKLDTKKYNPNYNSLLIEPSYVYDDYWKKGYFYTIGNEPLSEEEKNLDYGFFKTYSIKKGGYFVSFDGNYLDREPKYYSINALKTIYGVSMYLCREFIINESIDIDRSAFYEAVKELKERKEKEGYLAYTESDDCVEVALFIDNEKIIEIGNKINEIEELAYMNGYNWEVLIDFYLRKEQPSLLEGLDTNPEAGMYVGFYHNDMKGRRKAKKLFETLQSFINDEESLYEFIKKYKEKIEWD